MALPPAKLLLHRRYGYALVKAELSSDRVYWNLVIWTTSDLLLKWSVTVSKSLTMNLHFNSNDWLISMIDHTWERELDYANTQNNLPL